MATADQFRAAQDWAIQIVGAVEHLHLTAQRHEPDSLECRMLTSGLDTLCNIMGEATPHIVAVLPDLPAKQAMIGEVGDLTWHGCAWELGRRVIGAARVAYGNACRARGDRADRPAKWNPEEGVFVICDPDNRHKLGWARPELLRRWIDGPTAAQFTALNLSVQVEAREAIVVAESRAAAAGENAAKQQVESAANDPPPGEEIDLESYAIGLLANGMTDLEEIAKEVGRSPRQLRRWPKFSEHAERAGIIRPRVGEGRYHREGHSLAEGGVEAYDEPGDE